MMTFEEFTAANRKRCQESFGRPIDETSVTPMVLGLAEEAGEVSGAVRSMLGITKRKSKTAADVLDEIADVVQYADLLAACLGSSLESALVSKFNRVSERIGSPVRLESAQPARSQEPPGGVERPLGPGWSFASTPDWCCTFERRPGHDDCNTPARYERDEHGACEAHAESMGVWRESK
jgi:NTP pyrophosphatase (non-canonical NTP hydrolase)